MTLPLPLVIASGNPDKAREIIELFVESIDEPLAAWAIAVGVDTFGYFVDRPARLPDSVALLAMPETAPDVEETGSTLEENARIKAAALAEAVGVLAVGDDTGLEVDALGGAPGVYSARYAGPAGVASDNIEKLLRELGDGERRSARFVTVALARWPGGREVAVQGRVEGCITRSPRGSSGFGYDSVFEPLEGDGRTFAEMAPAEKHALSHRGRAFRALVETLGGD